MSNIERYEWLTVHDDGSLSADLRDTSPAETDRRMVITQELLAGRVVLAADHRGAVEAERERIVDDLRYGCKGMGDVVGPSIRSALADIIATAGER